MKTEKNKLLWFLSVIGLVATSLMAAAPTSEDSIGQSISLLKGGHPEEARVLLASIGTNDINYGKALCCDALCLYAVSNRSEFLKTMDRPEVQRASIPAAMREDLDFKRIAAMFYCRQLEDLDSHIQNFSHTHKDSSNLTAVAEYQLAGLFERGMKKTYEACAQKGTNGFNDRRWAEGRPILETFLSKASSFGKTNYQFLPKRTLREDVWQTRMALGQEAALLSDIPEQATADRERVGFLGIQLSQRLQPREVDQNLQRMARFLSQFPDSKNRKRVEFDMASISFSRGEVLIKEADIAQESGDSQGAAGKRADAHKYFDYTYALEKRLDVDLAAGVTSGDISERLDDLLYGYFLEKDYDRTFQIASTAVQNTSAGDLSWMAGKNYRGIVLMTGKSPNLKKAAGEFDDVLALGFTGRAPHDHSVLVAAQWQIYIAHQNGNDVKARELVRWVQGSTCTGNQKTDFLKKYSSLITP